MAVQTSVGWYLMAAGLVSACSLAGLTGGSPDASTGQTDASTGRKDVSSTSQDRAGGVRARERAVLQRDGLRRPVPLLGRDVRQRGVRGLEHDGGRILGAPAVDRPRWDDGDQHDDP